MSLHQRRTHPDPVPGCFGCHASTVGLLDPGRASLWKVTTDVHDTHTVAVRERWDGQDVKAKFNAPAQGGTVTRDQAARLMGDS